MNGNSFIKMGRGYFEGFNIMLLKIIIMNLVKKLLIRLKFLKNGNFYKNYKVI